LKHQRFAAFTVTPNRRLRKLQVLVLTAISGDIFTVRPEIGVTVNFQHPHGPKFLPSDLPSKWSRFPFTGWTAARGNSSLGQWLALHFSSC
jgi:hypothetical protein